MNCAEDPFNMGMFYNSRCHSKWVCFQIPNTHIRALLYWSRPPGRKMRHLCANQDEMQNSLMLSKTMISFPISIHFFYPNTGSCTMKTSTKKKWGISSNGIILWPLAVEGEGAVQGGVVPDGAPRKTRSSVSPGALDAYIRQGNIAFS